MERSGQFPRGCAGPGRTQPGCGLTFPFSVASRAPGDTSTPADPGLLMNCGSRARISILNPIIWLWIHLSNYLLDDPPWCPTDTLCIWTSVSSFPCLSFCTSAHCNNTEVTTAPDKTPSLLLLPAASLTDCFLCGRSSSRCWWEFH